MSRTRIIGGKLTEIVGGDHIIYSAGDIVTNSNGIISETAVEGTTYGEPEQYEAVDNKTGVKVTASIFFDGTKNNRNNTFRRLDKDTDSNTSKDSKEIYKKTKQSESSYENGYSNVAALSYMAIYDKKNREVVTYIEGQGTEDDQKGKPAGYAFGSGDSGIPAKATKGYALVKEDINKVYNKKEYVRLLTLNVFGFSRGAAAARHFITTTKASFKKDYPRARIVYKFVGLFDSVSSYHETKDNNASLLDSALKYDFENDVTELGLRLDGIAEKVVHLTAANEYRKNFTLTSIASSIAAGVGYELQLPGAHSDVGGGYEEYEHIEKRNLHKAFRDDDILIEEGWYTPEQIEDRQTINCTGTRKLKNSYQFIPLAIMMEFAKKHGMSFQGFDDNKRNKAFKVILDLENIKDVLLDYALVHDGAVSKAVTLRDITALKKLRNKYLHISSNEESLGMKENRTSFWFKTVARNIIEDNA
jgi:uncharacterized cupin superfamily protein